MEADAFRNWMLTFLFLCRFTDNEKTTAKKQWRRNDLSEGGDILEAFGIQRFRGPLGLRKLQRAGALQNAAALEWVLLKWGTQSESLMLLVLRFLGLSRARQGLSPGWRGSLGALGLSRVS